MNKLFLIVGLLTGLILSSCSIVIIDSHNPMTTVNQVESVNLSSNLRTRNGYTFIWEEYDGAPGEQQGDDSVVFGPSFGPYHNYSELVIKLKDLNTTYPEIIQVFTIGKTHFGREIYCVRITNESILFPKTEVVIVGQHHAQEQINVENALYFIDKVVFDFYSSSTTIQNLLNTKSIFVIPSLNIDGAELMSQNPWQRKTSRPIDEDGDGVDDEYEIKDVNMDGYVDRLFDESNNFVGYEGLDLDGDGLTGNDIPGGVDPNRNYAYNFGNQPGASDNPSAWNYHGPSAFSENCTARFRDFVMSRNFVTAVSLHSGMDYAMLLGPGHEGVLPGGDDRDLYISTGTKLQELTGFTLEMNGGAYATSGVWDDWMYTNDTLLVFTFETYGNPSTLHSIYNETTGYDHRRGVWDFCNPPGDKVIENSAQTYLGLLFMAQEAPYLSIQTKNEQVGEELRIEVTVTNPSAYIETNGCITLDWTVSQVTGLTPHDTKYTVNLGELKAKSSNRTTLVLSIDQPNYSIHIKLRANGQKVGIAVKEYDLDSSQITTESKVPVTLVGLIGLLIFVIIRRKLKYDK
ncbi:MAG: M14 family zinc carboxypeptidase [Candidatus Hodarchaeales archaeon]